MEHAATTTPNRDLLNNSLTNYTNLAEEDRLEDASVFYSQFKEFIEEEEDILVEVD